ncbi:RNase H domain-containing protein [Trichonephila clavipes]|nr:RNase H domain-containing protein [Trichonephila clavipes]
MIPGIKISFYRLFIALVICIDFFPSGGRDDCFVFHKCNWVPSHVNENADGLAREGIHKDSSHGGCLTFSEIATRVKHGISSYWRQALVHEWYEGNRPGAALLGTSSRRDETTLASLRSGHT